MADDVDEATLDGNAVAGLLAATMGVEMTAVPGQCAHCHTVSVVAQMRAYTRAPGVVLRCPTCSGVVLRVVETPTATLVDASGIAWLRFERWTSAPLGPALVDLEDKEAVRRILETE